MKEGIVERTDEYKYVGWWFSEANNIRRQLHYGLPIEREDSMRKYKREKCFFLNRNRQQKLRFLRGAHATESQYVNYCGIEETTNYQS